MAERGGVTREIRMRRSDGSIIPCLLSMAIVRNSAGRDLGVASVQDLSELKDLETQLQESNRLEAAGLIAGGIIHDLKNIFGMMQLSADLGKSSASRLDVQEMQALFEEIDRNCVRASALINQFLFFTRRERPAVEAVGLDTLLDETLRLLKPAMERGAAPTAVNVDNRLEAGASVIGNETQLQQVFVNLISNADTAMQEHETRDPKITITLRGVTSDDYFPLAKDGAWIRLEIRDNGPGMAPEVRARIFEPLYTRRKRGGGTGLGLTIVQQIVDGHGGYMTCESREGSGTCFTIWLPREAPGAAELAQGDAAVVGNDNSTTAPGARILVVDDEAAVLRLWKKVLDGNGWEVETCNDSRTALAAITRGERIDLLITDLAMPAVTGVELVQGLRDAGMETPVIVHSAFIQDDVVEKLRALAVTGFLTKPTSTRALLASVEKALAEAARTA
jgi:signal transduction histidine kinase/ActR/RegA family two-component response regulator